MDPRTEMRRILEAFPRQCEEARKLGTDIRVSGIDDVTVLGIGGSGLPGDVLRCLFPQLDITASKGYTLPPHVGKRSLVLAVSSSGNTEETLAATGEALARGAQIVGICQGGALEGFCRRHGLPCILLPRHGMQTRLALGYLIFPLLNVLQSSGLVPAPDADHAIAALSDPGLEQRGKAIAHSLEGKMAIIYTPAGLSCIGYGWAKTRLNETAKAPAFFNEFPLLTHDELSMYQLSPPGLHVIFFTDRDGDPRIRRRMELTADLLREKTEVTVIPLEGPALTKILTALHLGDWVAYHLAAARGVDPLAVPLQETVKRAMQGTL